MKAYFDELSINESKVYQFEIVLFKPNIECLCIPEMVKSKNMGEMA